MRTESMNTTYESNKTTKEQSKRMIKEQRATKKTARTLFK